MTDREKILVDGAFEELNNGYWIHKSRDPNQARWFTTEEALERLDEKNAVGVIIKMNETGEVTNIEDAMMLLSQRYAVSTTNEAKCIKYLINYIKSKKL